MGSLTLLLGLFSLFTFFPPIPSDPQNGTDGIPLAMDTKELHALFEVIAALLEDPNWTQMHPHPCSDTPWPGIQCELGQEQQNPLLHVTKLHIGPDVASPSCKNSATLSKSLLNLPYLKTLSILSCFLTSKVTLSPSLFGTFSSLEQLVLKSNPSLYGEIPPNLALVSNLRVLTLSQNSLHGAIPKQFGALGKLVQLDLSYNNLTGEIPQEIGALINLSILDISWNKLQGRVPYSIGQLGSIQKIDLSSNMIFGRLPPNIGKLKKLVLLDLSHNWISGPIPEGISRLEELEYLLLENNPIKTGVPSFLGTHGKLAVLSLSNCGLTGPIPTSFGSLEKLTALSLDSNSLTGMVPPALGALPNLDQLNLSNNMLSGELDLPLEFINKLGKRLDVRGNGKLCINRDIAQIVSQNIETHACLNSEKSSNSSWAPKSRRGPDLGGLKPPWYEGKGSSISTFVNQNLILWCLGSNVFVILMGIV